MTERHVFKSDKNRKSFQRWSDHRINQMTAATSLMFAISSAALGYAISVLSHEKTPVDKIATWPFVLAAAAFAISFVCGILVVFNRLDAFRETCEIIKLRDKREEDSLQAKRDENEETDMYTGLFFHVQFWSFASGGVCLVIHTFYSNAERVRALIGHLF
jgi:hypothetical protein